jgi:glycosyltransferase involved in cell wall biosynthesis
MTCCEYPPIGGGASAVVRGLAEELAVLGHRVELLTMRYDGQPRTELAGGVQVNRVSCIRLRVTRSSPPELLTYVAGAWPVARRLLRESPADIIHSHFIFPDGLLAWALRRRTGVPYILTAHGSDVPHHNPRRFARLHPLLAPAWKRITDDAGEIVSPSRTLAALIRARRYHGPLHIIPNGFHTPTEPASRHVPGRLLVVSRLFEPKGVQYVLRALEGHEQALELHVVGDGPYLPRLRSQAERLRTRATVRFHGWLDNSSPEFRELLETASIFALTSEAENFPTTLLEAMAAGLAIITTSGTGCEEVVGDAALLVPPRDPAQIRLAIDRLLADPALRDRLGRAAHARVHTAFGWRGIAERYVEAYERAILASRGT